jgi:hypothetical protein
MSNRRCPVWQKRRYPNSSSKNAGPAKTQHARNEVTEGIHVRRKARPPTKFQRNYHLGERKSSPNQTIYGAPGAGPWSPRSGAFGSATDERLYRVEGELSSGSGPTTFCLPISIFELIPRSSKEVVPAPPWLDCVAQPKLTRAKIPALNSNLFIFHLHSISSSHQVEATLAKT